LDIDVLSSSDGKHVDLKVAPKRTAVKGYRKITLNRVVEEGRVEGPGVVTVEQPEMEVLDLATELTITSGERVFMGAFRNPEFPGRMELYVLKAESKKVQRVSVSDP
jgi:hypothetical protein